MLVIFLVFTKLRNKVQEDEIEFAEAVKNIVMGLAFLIIVPVVSVILMITGIFLPISLILLALYFIVIYLSVGFGSYSIGKAIWKLTKKDSIWYAELAIGIILVYVVELIPYIGGLVYILVLFYGVGYIYNLIKKNK